MAKGSEDKWKKAAKDGLKIEAIRIYIDTYNVSLKAAKKEVEEYMTENKIRR